MTALADALRAHQAERANELRQLAAVLQQQGLSPDVGPILAAASQCLAPSRIARVGEPDPGAVYWGYEIAELRVALEPQRHCRPRSAVTGAASGTLSVRVEEYLPQELAQVGESFGHIRRLDTDFFVDVHHEIEGTRLPLRSAWHIDTHRYIGEATHNVHPRFHFQSGGNRFEEVDATIRAVFMPEAPRLPCAPLDAILALDFVLSHYCGDSWVLLHDLEPRYGRLRTAPMRRYWGPYFRTLSEGIADLAATPGGGAAAQLIPNICVASP